MKKKSILSSYYAIPIEYLSNRGYKYEINDNTNYFKSLRIKAPNVIKLHGSINWLYSENMKQIYFTNWKEFDFESKSADLKPFIIPPILDKSTLYSNNPILTTLWKQASEAIKNAKNIYIYGFSFPETDYYIKFLFQSALKGRNDYTIYVINKCYTKE